MHNLIQNYGFILNEFNKLGIEDSFYYKPIKPRMTDLQLVALNLTAEYCGIDSERQLFRLIAGTELGPLIERSVYNKRKRKLFMFTDQIRKVLADKLNGHEAFFVVDSGYKGTNVWLCVGWGQGLSIVKDPAGPF